MKNQEISIKTARLAIKKGVNLISDQTKVLTEKIGAGVVMTGYTLPTQTSLARWLREIHGYHFHIYYGKKRKWCIDIYFMWVEEDYAAGLCNQPNEFTSYKTYESVLEVGLYQALKLLEDIKTTF